MGNTYTSIWSDDSVYLRYSKFFNHISRNVLKKFFC